MTVTVSRFLYKIYLRPIPDVNILNTTTVENATFPPIFVYSLYMKICSRA